MTKTIDLTTALNNNSITDFLPAFDATLSQFDQLVVHVNFTGNQTLRMTNPYYANATVSTTDGACINMVYGRTLAFQDANGTLESLSYASDSCASLEGMFTGPQFDSFPPVLEFSSFSWLFDITYLEATSRTFADAMIVLEAEQLSIGGLDVDLPEPGSLAMFGLGIAALMAARKRKRV